MIAATRICALLCLLASAVLAMRFDRASATHASDAGRSPMLVRRLLQWYDGSPAGRRLSARLWRAQMDMGPSRWRAAQAMVAVPVTTTLVVAGMAPLAALGLGISLSRLGGSLLLWLRRHAATQALDEAAPALARALSVELADSGSGVQAVMRAAERCTDRSTARARVLARVMSEAADVVAIGAGAADAVRHAVQRTVPRLAADAPASVVAGVFALHGSDSAATATALEVLASALEDDALVRRQARASAGDAAMSAVAVPAIAAATLAIVLSSNPAALAAALTMPLIAVVGSAAVVVVGAATVARRLVAL